MKRKSTNESTNTSDDEGDPGGGAYLDPYRQAVQHYGATFEATLWTSKRSQVARFDVLTGMVDLTDRCILDAGCGLGDLCEYLGARGIRYSRYVGLDGLPSVIEKAGKRRLPRAEFHCVDFVKEPETLRTGPPDVIFFSGSLNTIPEPEAEQLVHEAFRFASVGVVFNFLSDQCGESKIGLDTGPATRFDTKAWLDWAFAITSGVAFRQDYLGDGHDATIGMWKDGVR